MSTPDGSGVDDAIRVLLLLMPRLVGRAKKMRVPEELRSFALAPRPLSLLAYLLFEEPPATVSLMVSDLSRKGILRRQEDEADRRRTLVSIADEHHAAINQWLGRGAAAWRKALEPLTPAERKLFIDTLSAYETAVGAE